MDKDTKTFVGMDGGGTADTSTPSDNNDKFSAQSITSLSFTTHEIVFSHKLDKSTAENHLNYLIRLKYGTKEQVPVVNAVLDSTGTKVILTTSTLRNDMLYNISFSGIHDIYGRKIDETQNLTFVPNPAH